MKRLFLTAAMLAGIPLCALPIPSGHSQADRIEKIHARYVFVDTHAHPSRFHRAGIERIQKDELDRYRRSGMDMVVRSVSSDAAYQGGYTSRDGTQARRLPAGKDYPIKAGEAFAFTLDRFSRILKTTEDNDVVLALSPAQVQEAKAQGRLALMAALEGADGLEGSLDNLRDLHRQGLRLLQLVHFRANDLGFIQTEPYQAGGLMSSAEVSCASATGSESSSTCHTPTTKP